MKLKDKVAIITGGGGGIGSVIAKYCLDEGAYVVIADISDLELKTTLTNLKKHGNDRVISVKTDVSNIEDVKNLIEFVERNCGTVDILVNAAAIQSPIGCLTDINESDWIKTININLVGTMLCCKYVLPIMISKNRGKIINFSGGGATFPYPSFSAYASSKAAIVRFTETIAEEVKDFGIDINSIAPGAVHTKMLEEIIQAGDKINKDELKKVIQIKKEGGNPPDLAASLVIFLASNESDGITGKLISAVWDDWNNFGRNPLEITKSSLFTLRRIDGMKFTEIDNKSDKVSDKV